jgi:flagellar hook-length control protein FliK
VASGAAPGNASATQTSTSDGGQNDSATSNDSGAGASSGQASGAATSGSVAALVAGAAPASASQTTPAQAGASASVPLTRLVDTVQMTLQTQAATGTSTVRIHLSPPELGEVRVTLQQTSAGVIARVVADHTSAAQTLQQSAGDLRRALEGSGVTLLDLDIGASDGQSAATGSEGRQDQSESGDPAPTDTGGEAAVTDEATQTLTLASGSVVNVLA